MKHTKVLWIAVLSLFTMVVLAWCSEREEWYDKNTTKETTNPIVAPSNSTAMEEEPGSPVKEFTMESYTNVVSGAYHPRFSIGQMNVIKWDKVIIHIKTTSGMHNFNLDEFNIHSETPKDETTTVEFIADQTGSFQYYCSKPGHRAAGHWGTLIVDSPSDK